MAEVRFTPPFKRRLKTLGKRYRQIQIDIQPIIDQLEAGNFIGEQISGIDLTVFKVRAKNSDIPTGKSVGYRVIYQVVSPECVLLLLIYAKSDQADVSLEEIEDAIKRHKKSYSGSISFMLQQCDKQILSISKTWHSKKLVILTPLPKPPKHFSEILKINNLKV